MTTTYRTPPGASGLGRKAAGALLEPAEYLLVKGLFVPPGLHRLYNATGLSLGLLGGRQLMNIVVGHTPDGTAIQRDEVPFPLRPLHGLLNYNVYSDDPRDRWMHAIDNIAPAILGAAGVLASSRIYFRENLAKAARIEAEALAGRHIPHPGGAAPSHFTFADADSAISMRHAEPYASATAGSSLFGSASAYNLLPWVGNYASMLGTLFSRRAERMVGMASAEIPNLDKFVAMNGDKYPWLKNAPRWMKNPLAFLTNTKANYPITPGEMFTQFAHVFRNNPAEAMETQREFWGLGSGIMLSWLKKADAFHIENFIKDYQRFLKESPHLSAGEAGKEYLTHHFEKFCVREGLLDFSSPQKLAECVDVGNGGAIGRFAEWAGMRAPVNTLRQRFVEGLYARNYAYAKELHAEGKLHFGGQAAAPGPLPGAGESIGSLKPESRRAGIKVGAAAGAGLLGMAALGSWSADTPEERNPHRGHTGRIASFVNHHPLDAAEWLGNSLNFPPSAHRWLNAFGLTGGMYTGMKAMELLTGLDVRGHRLTHFGLFGKMIPELAKIPENPLLAYNYHGAGMQDRWMKVLHMAVPAALGFYGNKLGSDWYFQPQQKRVRNPEYIDDYSSRIAFDQSRPWGYLAAATSLTNVGIGLNFLPFSYGMNMGTRFTLGSDRSTILPGVKELWSNNHSRSPLKPSKLRDEMINYMVGNPDKEPRLLEEKIRGILGPWFGQQPDSVINQFAADVMEVRNKYWKEGGIPADDRAKCKRELRERFVGKGLHAELGKLGLDVLKANLADNGLSGDIGNLMGARGAVNRDIAEFREKELARRAGKHPIDTDKEPAQEGQRPTFAERLAENRDRHQGTSQALH